MDRVTGLRPAGVMSAWRALARRFPALLLALSVLASAAPSWAATDPPRLANLSTRGEVLDAANPMIGGFVITGATAKTVVIRAIGPSLARYGVANALADPSMQIVRASDQATVASNDNWGSGASAAQVSASGFAPSDARESAVLVSLQPGAYTAVVSGVGGATGTALVEVYEVDHPEDALINISTRGNVLAGGNVMIGGFVVQGSGPQTVVVRARGPSLIPYGIANALANPTLQLVRSSDQATIATNDNYGTAPNLADLQATGFAPTDASESAILVTLDPGAYTAIVSGAGGGTGVAMVEAFAASAGTTQSTPPTTPPGSSPPPTTNYPWPTWTGKVIAVPPSTTGATWYVDGTNGNDANAGTSPTAAFRTVAKAVASIAAGDTVLIRKGLYREGINLSSAPSGTATKPITIGSYGDGEVILDGSKPVGPWTLVSGTVWRAQASFKPVGVVVNEVPLRQVREGQGGSTAPQDGLAGVTNGSGKWYVSGTNLITADFGAVIGSANPNQADIVVPNTDGSQEHVFWFENDYVTFKGLTVRGSGSNGFWGYGNHVTVESCDIKFNGKAAVSFLNESGRTNSDNSVLYSHAYHNNLVNWPRGNNGYMESGGGWPGTLVWDTNLRPLARGNIVHMNGGEGIISYGTVAGHPSGSALFEQNVAYDNWSVNMYFDNQPGNVARENLLYNHPPRNEDYLYVGTSYPWDSPGKFSVCLMLADEQNSSDSTNGYANLRGSQVYDNIMAGCRIGIRDYSEGTQAIANHGLKDTRIANNTIIMPYSPIPNADTFGIYLQDNKTNNTGSAIQNNVVYGFNQDAVLFTEATGAQTGLAIDYNDYYSAAAKPFGKGFNTVTFYDFAGWKSATPGADAHSVFADPLFVDLTQFRLQGPATWNYANANVTAGSPTLGRGTAQPFSPAVNFLGTARSGWNIGAY